MAQDLLSRGPAVHLWSLAGLRGVDFMHLVLPVVLAALGSIGASPRFPAAGTDAAWAMMPRESPALPAWALVLVKPLPRTTAAMLEQDRLHRADNPLGPILAAQLRWLAADAIGSEYARVTAAADLRRAGVSEGQLQRLLRGEPTPVERGLWAFARQVTKAAYAVTDEQFAELLKQFGPEKMTAVVETLAFANFQNRVILSLGVRVGPGGPCPPVDVRFDAKRRAGVATPGRPAWDRVLAAKPVKRYNAPADWKDVSFAELEERLAAQKARSPRIPVPDVSRFAGLPPDLKRQTNAIVWTKITAGYQPVMTDAWFAGLREFQQEARLDPIFGRTIFWVVTRANDCFY